MGLLSEENITEDFSGIASRTRKGFGIIRKELKDMKCSLDLMKNYLGQQKKDYSFYKKDLELHNDEFKRESEEFSSKLVKIKVLLSEFNTLRREMVIQRDLGKIEARIKISCKNEVINCKKKNKKLEEKLENVLARLYALEKGTVLKERKRFWIRKKKEKKKHTVLEILEEDVADKKKKIYSDENWIKNEDSLSEGDVKKLEERRVWTAEELKAEISGDTVKKRVYKIPDMKKSLKKISKKTLVKKNVVEKKP